MSRHHMLPPITYTPPPPKKVEKKTRRIGVGMLDETADMHETNGSGQSVPVKLPPANQPEIEDSDRKPQKPMGQLSQGMLAALLGIQEIK